MSIEAALPAIAGVLVSGVAYVYARHITKRYDETLNALSRDESDHVENLNIEMTEEQFRSLIKPRIVRGSENEGRASEIKINVPIRIAD